MNPYKEDDLAPLKWYQERGVPVTEFGIDPRPPLRGPYLLGPRTAAPPEALPAGPPAVARVSGTVEPSPVLVAYTGSGGLIGDVPAPVVIDTSIADCREATRCDSGNADPKQPASPTFAGTTEPDARWTPTELNLWTKVQERERAYEQLSKQTDPAAQATLRQQIMRMDAGVRALIQQRNLERDGTTTPSL